MRSEVPNGGYPRFGGIHRSLERLSPGPIASRMIWVDRLWITVAVLFGANLYFSVNSNINDPVVHWWVPVSKDLLWLAILTLAFMWRTSPLSRPVLILLIANTAFALFELFSIQFVYGSIEIGYVRFFKNFFLYATLTYSFVNLQGSRVRPLFLLQQYQLPLTLSLVASLCFFYLSPVKSIDHRLYGTYGNPTSLGFAALMGLSLIYIAPSQGKRWWEQIQIGLIVLCIMLTQSLSAFAALVVLVPLKQIFTYFLSKPNQRMISTALWRLATESARLALVVILVNTGLWLWGNRDLRVYQFAWSVYDKGRLPETESITIRREAYARKFVSFRRSAPSASSASAAFNELVAVPPPQFVRTDATILAYKYHFGWLGLIVLSLPFAAAAIILIRVRSSGSNLEAVSMAGLSALLLAFCLFNVPLQYQFDIFPTNFLFSSVLAAIIVSCGQREQAGAGLP